MSTLDELHRLRDDLAAIAAKSSARRLVLVNLDAGAELLERNGKVEREAKALHLQTERKIGELTS